MPRLLIKVLLFLSPYLALTLTPLCLPLNYFTFRCWEALEVFQKNPILSGPYYPLQKMAMLEEGDQWHGTPYAIKKSVAWETDRYGYRTTPSDSVADIVLVGDSFVVGTSLSQNETLSAVVAQKTGRTVYPYAPRNMNDFLQEARFHAAPPAVVIFEQVAGGIPYTPRLAPTIGTASSRVNTSPVLLQAAIWMDRIKKMTLLHWLCARIVTPRSLVDHIDTRDRTFIVPKEAPEIDFNGPQVKKAIAAIIGYHDYFKNRGVEFLFLPIPNKETVYSDFRFPKRPSTFLRQVEEELQAHGVRVIDLARPYSKCMETGSPPYHADDTHWNQVGVGIAADLITTALSSSPLRGSLRTPRRFATTRQPAGN